MSPATVTNLHDSASASKQLTIDEKDEAEIANKFVTSLIDQNNDGPRCLFLETPAEIRHMIYQELLVSPESLSSPNKRNKRENYDINPTILRTCLFVYRESLPVLYTKNRFSFRSIKDIKIFGHHQIFLDSPDNHTPLRTFNFRPAPYGRLTIIRMVVLKMVSDRCAYDFGNRHREMLLAQWRGFAYLLPCGICDESLGFPALESLLLDFSDRAYGHEQRTEPRVSLSLSIRYRLCRKFALFHSTRTMLFCQKCKRAIRSTIYALIQALI